TMRLPRPGSPFVDHVVNREVRAGMQRLVFIGIAEGGVDRGFFHDIGHAPGGDEASRRRPAGGWIDANGYVFEASAPGIDLKGRSARHVHDVTGGDVMTRGA